MKKGQDDDSYGDSRNTSGSGGLAGPKQKQYPVKDYADSRNPGRRPTVKKGFGPWGKANTSFPNH